MQAAIHADDQAILGSRIAHGWDVMKKNFFEMAKMSFMHYAKLIESTDPVVFVPVGAIEQHGPHLPLATDVLIPKAICLEVAKSVDGILAPPVSYGYKSMPHSGGGQHFCGTCSLDAMTLLQQLKDLIREYTRHGVSKLVFLIGHYENQWVVMEACETATREMLREGIKPARLMSVCYWELRSRSIERQVYGDDPPNPKLEHAGRGETSVMLHLHPELVDLELIQPQLPADLPVYDMWPYDPGTIPSSGVLNTAVGSKPEHGKLLFDDYVLQLTNAVKQAF